MEKLLADLLILMFLGNVSILKRKSLLAACLAARFMLVLQPTEGLSFSDNNCSSSGNIPATTMPTFTMGLSTRARADQNTTAISVTVAATAATNATPTTEAAEQPSDYAAHLFRSKKHALAAESSHHVRRHTLPTSAPVAGGTPAQGGPPYVYYNKLVSPDGKQELKEFQLLAPNVIIESVQHDMNYGPAADMGGVLLLNNGLAGEHLRPLAAKPSKHHHKHKSSSLAMPFLFMLQQMLQPGLSIELDAQRNRLEGGSNRQVFEHLLNEPEREFELNANKDMDKFKDLDGIDLLADRKAVIELGGKRKDNGLIVTCPIRQERHANNNGDIVDDDVVLVNECHIV